MDPCRVILSVILKMHEAFECELRTFIMGMSSSGQAEIDGTGQSGAATSALLAAEGVLSFEQGQRDMGDAMQTLERPTLK